MHHSCKIAFLSSGLCLMPAWPPQGFSHSTILPFHLMLAGRSVSTHMRGAEEVSLENLGPPFGSVSFTPCRPPDQPSIRVRQQMESMSLLRHIHTHHWKVCLLSLHIHTHHSRNSCTNSCTRKESNDRNKTLRVGLTLLEMLMISHMHSQA